MTDLTKEELIKLAEIAGVTGILHQINTLMNVSNHEGYVMHQILSMWNPAENIDQAMGVLNNWLSKDEMRHWNICSPHKHIAIKHHEIDLYVYDSDGFLHQVATGHHEFLPMSICNAVLKASEEG